jgi:ribosomal protein S18 acetylase RimI-like enzyme
MTFKTTTIRHAYLEEYEVVAILAIQSYEQFRYKIAPGLWPVMKNWVSETTSLRNGGELLIASRNESIVGSIVYCSPGLIKNSHFSVDCSFMMALTVLPNQRRTGIGRALLGSCLELAQSDKSPHFCLYVSSLMTEAEALFTDNGFIKTASFRRLYGIEYNLYAISF